MHNHPRHVLLVGGSGSIGSTILQMLVDDGVEVTSIDRLKPDASVEGVNYIEANLGLGFEAISDVLPEDVDGLIYAAGLGRLNYMDELVDRELDLSLTVNAIVPIMLIRHYYQKIKSSEEFRCAVFTSIAGRISSPLYSFYSASKAALTKFIESVNSELSTIGSNNRIIEIAPGKVKGTRFHGENSVDPDAIRPMARCVVDKFYENNCTLYIPDSDIYANVIMRYQQDPDAFGIESCAYKLEHSALEDKPKVTVGYLTGCFDLFHVGHLNLLRKARSQCDYLVVGVHKDGSHKGKQLFISLEERMQILKSIRYVDEVIVCSPEDCDDYDRVHYDYLFVGSDYYGSERFRHYQEVLEPRGVKIVYFPYTKGTSSTQIRKALTTR